MVKQKFYRCPICGNIIAKVQDSGVAVVCCGKPMVEIIPCTVEASKEKQIPEFKVENNIVTVTVGSIEHPMVKEHYIEWISLQTKYGNQRRLLEPNQKPEVSFALLDGDEVEVVYAYCNLHGLWIKENN